MKSIKIEKHDGLLMIREEDKTWRFSGLLNNGQIGKSMGEEYSHLFDEDAARLLLSEAQSLGFLGKKEGTDQAGLML